MPVRLSISRVILRPIVRQIHVNVRLRRVLKNIGSCSRPLPSILIFLFVLFFSTKYYFKPNDLPPPRDGGPKYRYQTKPSHNADINRPIAKIYGPRIRILLSCPRSNPCCSSQIRPALQSVLQQTLNPKQITIIHLCRNQTSLTFANAVKTATKIASNNILSNETPRSQYPLVSIESCTQDISDIEACLLHHLATTHPTDLNGHTLVTTSAIILEPITIESLWLFSNLRNLSASRLLASSWSSAIEDSTIRPPVSRSISIPTATLPLLVKDGAILAQFNSTVKQLWIKFAHLFANARIFRSVLYEMKGDNISSPTLALRRDVLSKQDIHPHLWSERSFYRWSARLEVREDYAVKLDNPSDREEFDVSRLPLPSLNADERSNSPLVFIIVPWMQMGGSEKSALNIAERMISKSWLVTFVLTMPFWGTDGLGELCLKNDWIGRVTKLTSDVFNVVSIAPNHKFSKALRYLLESRNPEFILMMNSRTIYEHAKFIKSVLPRTIIADYNHMVHMSWKAAPGKYGGIPRFATENTKHIDLHLTASQNVTTEMRAWISPDELSKRPQKIQTCYIGTEPRQFHDGIKREIIRYTMRKNLGIDMSVNVILFAGRFVADKGINVLQLLIESMARNPVLLLKFSFVFVGTGRAKNSIESTAESFRKSGLHISIHPPPTGHSEMRDYYAMADILLLPSINEGIALVIYEAMAAGLLVICTDVGGQREVVNSNTGVLLPAELQPKILAQVILQTLYNYSQSTSYFRELQKSGTERVRRRFTNDLFCDCVMGNLKRVQSYLDNFNSNKDFAENRIEKVRLSMAEYLRWTRVNGMWRQRQVPRSPEELVTVGIIMGVNNKLDVLPSERLVKSLRLRYTKMPIILLNEGPVSVAQFSFIANDTYTMEVWIDGESGQSTGFDAIVNITETEYILKVSDYHFFNRNIDFDHLLRGISNYEFEIIGFEVQDTLIRKVEDYTEDFIAKWTETPSGEKVMCVLEGNETSRLYSLRVPVHVDIVKDAWIARTDMLQNLHIAGNSKIYFFFKLRKGGVKVGFLPSVILHRKASAHNRSKRTENIGRTFIHDGNQVSLVRDVQCGRELFLIIQKQMKLAKEIK